MEDLGYAVLRFRHDDDWEALIVRSIPSVFGAAARRMSFAVGSLVRARGREWVVLPESGRRLPRRCARWRHRRRGRRDPPRAREGRARDARPAQRRRPRRPPLRAACSATPSASASAPAPARSAPFGHIAVEPRPYQLVPLLMALRARPGPPADRRRRRHRQDDRGAPDRPRAARPRRSVRGSPCSARRTWPSSGRRSCATSSTSRPSWSCPAPPAGSSGAAP